MTKVRYILNYKTLLLRNETRYIDKMYDEFPLSLIKHNSELIMCNSELIKKNSELIKKNLELIKEINYLKIIKEENV